MKVILHYNNFTKISSNVFANSPKLSTAFFGYNQISEIDPDGSDDATSLTAIDFMHNRLTTIPPNIFAQTTALKYAYFGYNQINRIDSLTFAKATKLERIDISHNRLETIPSNVFANNLRRADFSSNQISEIDPV